MDLQFDNYTSYSDASTPRTPSPRTSICSDDLHPPFQSPHNFKPQVDVAIARNIFDPHSEDTIIPEAHAIEAAHMWNNNNQYPYPQPPGSRGSLLDELYDHDIPEQNITHHDVYVEHHHQPTDNVYQSTSWSNIPQSTHHDHIQPPMRHLHDVAMTRRATFPYVRHDRGDILAYPHHPFMSDHDSLAASPYTRPGTMYGEPLPMDSSPHLPSHHFDEPFAHTVPMTSPHSLYDHLDGIKTEDQAPVIVPSQNAYCRPPSAGMHPLPCLSPHAGLLVQHTDDAASKETQYLRRRCFNCHTTEPPSWRRSTLNPGKIVCNKCGLYERTHLRPRPLRFDELRAGSKTRKQPKVGGSPKAGKLPQMVKKEPRDGDEPLMQRRASVSSNSSVHSGGATSDWDDNVSVYSSGSAPPSSFNSPAVTAFPIPRDPNSQSPPLPRDGGIRLPNAPLSDIASLQSQSQSSSPQPNPPTPRKSATAPFYSPQSQAEMFARRGSLPVQLDGTQPQQQQAADNSIPEVTGWQSVPMSDLNPSKPLVKPRSNSLRKAVVA